MCINPSFIYLNRGPNVERTPVACKSCWQCQQNRVNDYVGRSLCEMAYSTWTTTLTLTYGDQDDLSHRVITPRHFQNFVKKLRRRGHSLRYLVTAEYGDLYGRAHFHCVLFGKGKPLQLPQKQNFHLPEWGSDQDTPFGYVWADNTTSERAMRYVCKYLLEKDNQQRWFSVSKKPPLGAEFFAQKAHEAISLGVLPSTFEYLPPGGDRGRPYLMTGATRRDYLAAVIKGFREHHPSKKLRLGEWVAKSLESYEWKAFKKHHAEILDGMDLSELIDNLQISLQRKQMNPSAVRAALWQTSQEKRDVEFQDWLDERSSNGS